MRDQSILLMSAGERLVGIHLHWHSLHIYMYLLLAQRAGVTLIKRAQPLALLRRDVGRLLVRVGVQDKAGVRGRVRGQGEGEG